MGDSTPPIYPTAFDLKKMASTRAKKKPRRGTVHVEEVHSDSNIKLIYPERLSPTPMENLHHVIAAKTGQFDFLQVLVFKLAASQLDFNSKACDGEDGL